jgi:16S rRNA (guanine(527)-N(7))-methyltransferase RsmG
VFDEYPALKAHHDLLQLWNKRLNLTRIDSIERNYGESLFLGRHLPPGLLRICDIGSGPGFPGFPVAILRPDCQVTLIESHQRKAVFLKEASRDIPNIRVLAKRGQDVTETFDWAISRAVSAEDLVPFLTRLAPNFALLTGAEEPSIPGIAWDPSIPLPDSDSRFLRIGHVR